MIRDKSNSEHYFWGDNCQGWRLLKDQHLSVIDEEMPPQTCEKFHFHEKSQQVFYIREGVATFSIEEDLVKAKVGQAVVILPGQRHRICNESEMVLKFLVISQPATSGDRIEV
jgi:mannose-6-phosphate isomerase-like protein (cupin superfamily)